MNAAGAATDSRSRTLVWISGASSGIGEALARSAAGEGSRVIGVSRRRPPAPAEHLQADLADPSSWGRVGESFAREASRFEGDRIVFIHAAGIVDPVGFAGEVETGAYTRHVLLNSAAPQVLGHLFLEAVRGLPASRHLVMLSSGAARSVYAGWSGYGAAKAAVDQWVRNVGEEQRLRGGVQVLAIAPGTVATAMQERLRVASEESFPARQKFIDLHRESRLTSTDEVAERIWALLGDHVESGSVLDLRQLQQAPAG